MGRLAAETSGVGDKEETPAKMLERQLSCLVID
jgi:hypothetical protein